MIETYSADSAVVVMCWDNGGQRLVGMMIVRRADGHACFVDLPPALEERLAVLDLKFVEEKAARLLEIAYEGLDDCKFEGDQIVPPRVSPAGVRPCGAGDDAAYSG